MAQKISLKHAERKVFRMTFQDGLWDIYIGIILFGLGIIGGQKLDLNILLQRYIEKMINEHKKLYDKLLKKSENFCQNLRLDIPESFIEE